MKGNVIQMNTLHLNSVRLNGIGKVQSVSLKGGSTEDPVFPPVEPPVEPTPTYTLSASVTNGKVSATRNGSAVNLPFTANEGDTIVIEVTPNEGYSFEGWADGVTDNPRSITMNADVALSAQCVEVVQPPVGNYIQFADAEVERVLMSKGVSSDGVGITMEDAAAVTSISTWFKGNTTIRSFKELVYFVNVTTLAYNAFSGCSSLTFIDLANILSLGGGTFYNCTKLATANLVNIRNIASYDFFGCSALAEDLNLPYLEKVGSEAFKNSGITSIIAPSILSMGYNSFSACKALRNIDLGSNLTTSGESAFYGCSALEIFICRATTPPTINGYYLYGTSCPIYVPDASLEAYKTALNWVSYADRIHPLSEIEDYYISDALLMHLDGINKGNVEGEWQDLVSGKTFVNHGAIAEADGWRFDGASSYMDSETMTNYGPRSGNRTFEVVAEFERGNTTEIVYMGASEGYVFGRYVGGKCIIITNTPGDTNPTFEDDMTAGVRAFAVAMNASMSQIVSKINGNDGKISDNEQFTGSNNSIYLGKRASGNHFKGIIHAIRIHDRILSEEEILYNQRIDNKRFNLGLDI